MEAELRPARCGGRWKSNIKQLEWSSWSISAGMRQEMKRELREWFLQGISVRVLAPLGSEDTFPTKHLLSTY